MFFQDIYIYCETFFFKCFSSIFPVSIVNVITKHILKLKIRSEIMKQYPTCITLHIYIYSFAVEID